LKRRRRQLFYLVQAASLAASLAWTLATRDLSLTGLAGPLLASLADDIVFALASLLARLL